MCDHSANFCSDIKISIHVVKLQKKGRNGSSEKCSVFPIVNNQRGWTEDKESKQTLSWIANRTQVLKVSTTDAHCEHQCATLTSTGLSELKTGKCCNHIKQTR